MRYASIFQESFGYQTDGTTFSDGAIFGRMTSVFNGGGTNKILAVSNSNVLYQKPAVATSPELTYASLVTSRFETQGDIDFTVRVQTVSQLRTGSSPNPWETAWVLWNYTDNTHFYYFALKTNGYELGKADPAYPGNQRYLATGGSGYSLGQWYTVRVIQTGNIISIYVDGTLVVSFTDSERPYLNGKIGCYNEDAETYFDDIALKAASPIPSIMLGPGLQFDGVDGLVTVPDNSAYSVTTTGELTVECWIQPDTDQFTKPSGTGYVDFISKAEYPGGGNQVEWQHRIYNKTNSETDWRDNELSFYVFNTTGGIGVSGDAKKSPKNTGRLIHLVGTLNNTTKIVTLWKNGKPTEVVSYSSITPGNTTGRLSIGGGVLGDAYATQGYFKGLIAELRIYNRVLKPAEIQDRYNFAADIRTGLVGWWDGSASGSTILDLSVTGNNGTKSGGCSIGANTVLAYRKPIENVVSIVGDNYNPQRLTIRNYTHSLRLVSASSQYAYISNASQVGLNFGLHDFAVGGWFRVAPGAGLSARAKLIG